MSLYPVQNVFILYRVILFIYGGILWGLGIYVCGGDLFSFLFLTRRQRALCLPAYSKREKIREKSWDFPRILWGKTAQNVGFGLFYGGNVSLKGEFCDYVR